MSRSTAAPVWGETACAGNPNATGGARNILETAPETAKHRRGGRNDHAQAANGCQSLWASDDLCTQRSDAYTAI